MFYIEILMKKSNLSESLLRWGLDEKSTYLGEFFVNENLDPDDIDKLCAEDASFSLALKHTKLRIAQRLRNKLGKKGYSSTLFNREIGMYDLLLADYERKQMRTEQMIKKDLGEETNFVNLIEYIKSLESEEIIE